MKRERSDQGYYNGLLESHISAFDWYQNQWPSMTLYCLNNSLAEIIKVLHRPPEINWKKIDPDNQRH